MWTFYWNYKISTCLFLEERDQENKTYPLRGHHSTTSWNEEKALEHLEQATLTLRKMASARIISSLFPFSYSGFQSLPCWKGVESDAALTRRVETGATALTESTDGGSVALAWICLAQSAFSRCTAPNAPRQTLIF